MKMSKEVKNTENSDSKTALYRKECNMYMIMHRKVVGGGRGRMFCIYHLNDLFG